MSADLETLERQLHREGFQHTYFWQDGPNAFYSDHTHPVETAHIILDGEMTLTQGAASQTYRAGERCHSSQAWPRSLDSSSAFSPT